ncbi:hypothetical protein OVA24_01515 [Luteolibacter sp. SL250]|uniref:hypothetical protein n=1 Tax=Luteolibacter sp. SL250 TaxID=2995170 RepID=UPI00226DDBCE|nr:hypothetical protein [Luteolibacter sp. SL250]WAC20055.1 hypothetical protein OVA24_01515 [Luteolibacter sp. SL250]
MKKQRLTRAFWLSWLIRGGAAGLTLQAASAHQFWLERTQDGKFIARFGEAGSNGEKPGYEKSPGVLDKMQGISVWSMYPAKSGIEPELYKAKPQEDGFLVEDASAKLPLLAQTTFPVRKRAATAERPASASFTTAFARWQPAGATGEPTTTLDVIPAAEGGKATVYYKGKPVAGARVTLFSPTAEPLRMESDAAGNVTFKAGGKGDFILWAHHSEPATGTYLGTDYTSLSYMICLCWRVE